MEFLIIVFLFIVLVGGGWLVGKSIGKFLFPNDQENYIDRSVHFHTTIHNHKHEHRNISIIDETTKKNIFELKDKK